jgi:hypothetical protein
MLVTKSAFYLFICFSIFLLGCTKEVNIDIKGFEQQLVVEGTIETGGFPIVLLSRSQDVYAPTNIGSYLGSFISDASVSVTNGTQTIQLSLFSINDLPEASKKTVAELLKLEYNEVGFLPILVYSTTDPGMKGEIGKSYTLNIVDKGKNYSGTTAILPPVALDNLTWRPESSNPAYGYSYALLSDPANEYNAYKWEAKRINIQANGEELDTLFRKGQNGYFDDRFFDGITFEFDAPNRQKRKKPNHLEEYKRFYMIGDSVVVKMSRIDKAAYEFFYKKDAQVGSAGNPFATPVNVPSNITGGALGIWAGVSPWYDTLYCIP